MGMEADFLVEIEQGFHPEFDSNGTYNGGNSPKKRKHYRESNKVSGVENWILRATKKSTRGDWQRLIFDIVEQYKVFNPEIKDKTKTGTFLNISANFKEFKTWFKSTKQ